jgi:hypothetical protein
VCASLQVPYGQPRLECVGADPGAPAQIGVFGYLQGYYYYSENQYVGPLLRNVAGVARVPPITVTLTDIYQQRQTRVVLEDGCAARPAPPFSSHSLTKLTWMSVYRVPAPDS